ncbi:response regulator [Actinoplanes sp. NPDC051346]|uniref:response regulator n=1 Tax=Actinoplanes sp. NPDC051346 TaxID=3155048 RepID=UPI003413F8C7
MPHSPDHLGRPHLLFVDDEPHVLAGLRRMLHHHADRWLMSFASNASDAVEILSARPCHVIISDYHMPGTGGATLLQYVSVAHPHTARVILSAETNTDDVLIAMSVAQRFLAKPCTEQEILDAVEALLGTPPAPPDPSTWHSPALATSAVLA